MKLQSQLYIVIKRTGWILLVLAALTAYAEQTLTHSIEKELSSMEGISFWVWFFGGTSIALSILNPVIISILVLASLLPAPVTSSIKQHAQFLCKETLRAAGKSMAWGFLFLLPGLIRFLQFSFVSFVVMLDPEYSAGKKDALRESTRLVNQRFYKVTTILLLFSVIIPLSLTSLDEFALFGEHPFLAILLSTFDAVLSILCILMLLKQWEKSHGTHVQLEAN